MKIDITKQEFELLIESLTYSKQSFEEYSQYPNEELKNERINSVNNLLQKLRETKS